jgi:glyoxylase-like metal-dependent hydrolase (beta-lactamase superfamily II)
MIQRGLLVGLLVCAVAASSVHAQGRGRGQGGGQGQQGGGNNNNVGMPWEPLRNAVMTPWEGRPFTDQKTEPFKVFDNVYYVGIETVGSYLVTTNAGLILFDSTYPETADHILDGVKKLGFDPANIKYLIITHQHTDHFGGAPRVMAAVPAMRIGVSAPEWDAVTKATMIPRDLVINDGDMLKLGDTTLKFYVVPGHTIGNLVTEIQAKGNGKTFRTLIGVAFAPAPGLTEASIKSTERLKQLGPWDALLTSHSYLAPVSLPLTAQQILAPAAADTRNATGHPSAQGAQRINAYFDQILKATRDRLAREQAQAAQPPTR